jgi:hypothetical protein
MRHQGLRRISPPYPGAADLHFPLIDSLVERLKPFYYQQLYGTDQFAAFVSLKTQPADTTSSVANWFDFRLKQRSNLERKILSVIDHVCMAGRAPIKVYWDFDTDQICYAAIDPIYFIVPKNVIELGDAPWCIHVMHYNEDEYKANENFRQDDSFIKSIKGNTPNDAAYGALNTKYQEVGRREGITVGQTDEQIVIWEIYRRKDGEVYFDTFSPMRLNMDDAIRERQVLPYDHGQFPFVSFRSEIKDEGWYSPRGIPEIVAAFEDSLCRQWNAKHDYMDFVNKPLFKNTGNLGNTANVTFLPGQTLPQGVEPAQMPAPPVSFDEEMQTTRALAEYRITIPDLGATQHLSGKRGYGGEKPTATQIQAIVGQSSLSDDMRARVFRLDAADMFKMSYSLLKQFDSKSLEFVVYDEVGQLPDVALHDQYEIVPNGSADSWNKPAQLQKAVTRMQLFGQSPYWKRNELEKSVMELDDPRLIKRCYTDPGQELQDQMEVQAQEISIMLLGYPAAVHASDDDKAHLQSVQGFVDRRTATGEAITPELAKLLLQHCAQHDNALVQKKDPQLGVIRAASQPLIQYLGQKANQPDMNAPQNVVPGPGAPGSLPPAAGSQPGAGGAQPKPPDPVGDATKIMNALAALIKAGVPITQAELNTAFSEAGLPPLATQPVVVTPPPPQPAAAGGQP